MNSKQYLKELKKMYKQQSRDHEDLTIEEEEELSCVIEQAKKQSLIFILFGV